MIEGFRAAADSSCVQARLSDISEWRGRHQQRVVLAELANEVADELTNLLAVLAAHQLSAEGIGADDSLHESVAAIRASAARAVAATRRLLACDCRVDGSATCEPRTVLIVDEDEVTRELMAKLLARDGYHVLSAPTIAEGLRAAGDPAIDLLIFDHAATLRLTSSDRQRTVELEKPLSSRTLLEGVRGMLEHLT